MLQIGKLNSASEFRIHTGGKKKEWIQGRAQCVLDRGGAREIAEKGGGERCGSYIRICTYSPPTSARERVRAHMHVRQG
jgi:hypothetical protein